MNRFLASLSVLAFAAPAYALNSGHTDEFDVTTDVVEACTIFTASDLNFPDYDAVSGAAVAGSSVIQVACTCGTDYEISLNQGLHNDGLTRRMENGGVFLDYTLSDPDGNDWQTYSAPPSVSVVPVNYTVDGEIQSGQFDAIPGAYSDTIIATLTF